SFQRSIEKTVIVYGTRDDEAGNRDAAARLQKRLQQSWFNWLVPIESDTAVSEAELKDDSIVLIGRPSTNAMAEKAAAAMPVTFGPRSFSVRGTTYGHPLSAVIAAGVSPWNAARSVTIVAGNDAESTVRAAETRGFSDSEVVVLLRDGEKKPLV